MDTLTTISTLALLSFFPIFLGLAFVALILEVYGAYLAFRKKWYLGVIALAVPPFGLVLAIAKILGRDFL